MTKLSLRFGLPMAILCGFAGLALAAASPVIYHSGDRNNPGTPHALDEPTEILEIYYRPGPMGTATGEICLDGDGDEICGNTIEIQSTGDVTFDSLDNGTIATPEPGLAIPLALGALAIGLACCGRRALV